MTFKDKLCLIFHLNSYNWEDDKFQLKLFALTQHQNQQTTTTLTLTIATTSASTV